MTNQRVTVFSQASGRIRSRMYHAGGQLVHMSEKRILVVDDERAILDVVQA